MARIRFLPLFALAAALVAGAAVSAERFDYRLPPGIAPPAEPAFNPTNAAKVELGRRLFYDGQLARDGLRSCASCHAQARAFTDPFPFSWGVTGEHTARQTPSLANVGFFSVLTWANPDVHLLEEQASGPMFGTQPIEMGMLGQESELIERVKNNPVYPPLFAAAFPENPAVTIPAMTRAIAAFERTLVSLNSPYDRAQRGEAGALSESAKRGQALFFSDRLKCGECHGGPFFTDAAGPPPAGGPFHNTGLYNVDNQGAYPASNTGIHRITAKAADMGRFKTPTLRNIAVTAPYMHDGSLESLEAVIDHYAAGGGRRSISQANAGDGRSSPLKDPRLTGFSISPAEKADLIAFLNALTDEKFLTDPRLSDPWTN